jgi:hypothetical protein
VGVGLVRVVSGIVVAAERFPVVIGTGAGVSTMIYDVTTGVAVGRVLTGVVNNGSIPAMPEFIINKKIMMSIITAIPAPIIILCIGFGSRGVSDETGSVSSLVDAPD